MTTRTVPRPASIPVQPGGGLATKNAPALDLPMRFVAVGLLWLALAALLMPWGLALLAMSFYVPAVLALVHMFTLGFIGNIIIGASYQLVPVALGVPLRWPRLGRLTWWLLTPGVVALVLGLWRSVPLLLALGGTLLIGSVTLFATIIAGTLRTTARPDVIAWHVGTATAALVIAATLGLLLACNKSGDISLGGAHFQILAAHITLMVVGWVSVMIAGVSSKLVPMFTLTEDLVDHRLAGMELALLAGGAAGLALAWGLPAWAQLLALPAALAVSAGGGLLTAQLLRLYRRRRRRTFDIHMPFTLAALAFGMIAALLLVAGVALARPLGDWLWTVVIWLALAGWAGTMIQGHMYKIATFLIWLHRYAPLAGKTRLPRLDDLYSRRLGLVGAALWVVGVAAAAL
ncbi:MAG TPA: hypothetical protein DEP84_23790, partial [Chloroflexi bacterium]|nr:hypothetical protein [Chloroflexota bacterium]